MADILMLEAANLFIGDENPEAGKHLKIENLTLPNLENATADHMGGGAAMGVKFSMGILNPLEMQFKLVGFDEEAYAAAGIGSNQPRMFTIRGLIRRKSDGKGFQAVALVRGCMGKVTADQFQRSQIFGHDHAVTDITRYKFSVAGKDWYEVDFFQSKRVRFGIDELAEMRDFLGLN